MTRWTPQSCKECKFLIEDHTATLVSAQKLCVNHAELSPTAAFTACAAEGRMKDNATQKILEIHPDIQEDALVWSFNKSRVCSFTLPKTLTPEQKTALVTELEKISPKLAVK